ncbi:MAG: LLM class F420-dependent oxidoreductase [Candidatus Actinomarina sp.]|jgi:F420-dependent oxidoreductase-like protein|nr:LLM class F420-dependent oxidoreductase [Candidatus Actinomarina sp.]|tara:strand:- start:2438 stop:3478 length:1041 start_codon:yes stop_codon:yes gene_type:complete
MELSINVGYFGPHISDDHDLIKKLDDMGFSCIWTAEAYGYDAVTPLSYFSALTKNINIGSGIMQIPGRTPAMTAMTAITLDKLSKGRFRLGLGVSGPQVVEGWHGQPYSKPLSRTREYIEIIRDIINREEKVTYNGNFYNLPYNGPDSLNLGKPLKLIEQPVRKNIPIYLAAIGPKNIELSAELADGWLPFMYSPTKGDAVFSDYLSKGFKKSNNPDKSKDFNIVATVFAKLCDKDQVEEYLRPARTTYTLYVGGMGAKDKNFYFNLMCEYGYEDVATKIQDLYLDGQKQEAEQLFPDELLKDLTLVGTKQDIEEKYNNWKNSKVTELSISLPIDMPTLEFIKELN